MIKDSGKKLFDVVLVWKFDRFARNRFDSANYKMILKKNGVHLISVMEPIAEGSQGILVETLLEGMAEYYSAELSEKVIRGQTENALKGKCTGGTGTIGYKIDEEKFYHLDPLTSPLVLEAFQRYGIQVTAVELGDIHTGFTQARQKVIVGDKEYGGRISRSVSQMEKDEQNGASPEVIGAYIAKIIEKKCKPICVAGAQYKFLSLLCKLLPCGLRGKIVGAIYAK